jgi:hypothetical protein
VAVRMACLELLTLNPPAADSDARNL